MRRFRWCRFGETAHRMRRQQAALAHYLTTVYDTARRAFVVGDYALLACAFVVGVCRGSNPEKGRAVSVRIRSLRWSWDNWLDGFC